MCEVTLVPFGPCFCFAAENQLGAICGRGPQELTRLSLTGQPGLRASADLLALISLDTLLA